jgi:prepilin-type N-terminal cleavage/methylation domain-containing protein
MQKHPTHKSAKGFTLIELVIAVAVIGILTTIAILGYNQYKVRAYDAHSKQVLHNILLQCNAFWLEHDALKACEHPTEAEVYVAGDEIVIKFPSKGLPDLPAGSQGNFCASAQHVSSPNTYSIDSASSISDTEDCGGVGGSVQTASAGGSVQTAPVREPLEPKDWECVSDGNGPWTRINSPGNKLDGWCVRMFLFPFDDKDKPPRYSFVEPNGAPQNYGNGMPPRYPNGYLTAAKQFAAEGNEIIAFDYPEGFSEPASFYTATLDDQGKVIEVDDSRKVTFSEWNSKSTEERKEITGEARKQDKKYCQHLQRTLPPDFFARMEHCPDKQLWIP